MQGKTINGFELKRQLGVGGMAEVWYAENRIGKKAAVKLLLPKLCQDEKVVSRFLTEAKVMVDLNHPNIRQVYDYGELDGRPTIIMEYLEGDDLKARMKRGQRFTDEELKKWWNQLVSALNYTHQKGIVHRDIKPGNIFVDTEGNIKLLDFGIAKVRESISSTQTGQKLGTLMYMSPEQVKDSKHIDYHTDIYSLAVTFVHLLTGKKPYDSDTSSDYDIQVNIVTKPLDLSGVPTEWRNFLTPYLNKEASQRPALRNFDAVQADRITQTVEDDGTVVEGTSKPKDNLVTNLQANGQKQVESKKPKRKKKWPWLVAVGVVVVAVVLTLVLNGSKNYARPFSEGLAFAQINGKVGYIDKSGEMVLSLPQCDIGSDFHEGLAAVRDKKSSKWGYIDKTGKQVVSFQYQVDDFSEGLAHVWTSEGEHFFIDKTGERVVSFSYDTSCPRGFSVGDFHEGVAVVRCGGCSPEYFLINKMGEIVLELPYHIESEGFHEGLAVAYGNSSRERIFINTSGQQVMSFSQYDIVWNFSDGMARVGVATEKENDGSYKYDNVKWGYIDKSGTEIIRPQYNYTGDFSEGLAPVKIKDKYGYIDKTGNIVIPLQYDGAQEFSEGLACVRKNNKLCFIDKSGNVVITVK